MARFTTLARSLKRVAPALAGAGVLALSTGCCCGAGGGYGSYYGAPGGGCESGQCSPGYGSGYGAPIYPQGAMAAPMGPTASAPVYYQTAAAPQAYYVAPTQTAAAPVNCVPTY
ncbi:hypothetical protein [Alienimonas californiensis]|uniref:Uncharacterized protein n=1 Tax=Alienimonas californiensis TaxID=2527989 RepID=A0A517P970_9PLAN|nr:hypothetical protein [Alienimonas californiensis]QDT15926.1 hypothetical protein CA12_20240 [Alienimonas californiensis]